jgi:DNA-binding IclR family transcriptional regulator
MSPEERSGWLGGGQLERHTPRTIVSFRELELHLESVRAQGYALNDEEIYQGVRALAAPVRDYSGEVVAAVGFLGPATRITLERIPQLAEAVVAVAEEISRQAGHSHQDQRRDVAG